MVSHHNNSQRVERERCLRFFNKPLTIHNIYSLAFSSLSGYLCMIIYVVQKRQWKN